MAGVASFQMYFENHSQLCQLAASCSLGFVMPWLAAWLPVVGFGALAAVLTLRAETV